MKVLTETIISVCELAEAEGRLLKQNILNTLLVGLLIFLAASMWLIALGLMLAALYQGLLIWFTPGLALFIIALVSLLIAGGVLWLALRLNRTQ